MDILEIKKYMKVNKITYQELSDISKIPITTLKDIFRGKTKNPRIDTMNAIEKALNIPNSPPVVVEFNNFRSGYKDCIVVYDHSGDVHEFSFNMEDLEHILNVCEAITKNYKKIKY